MNLVIVESPAKAKTINKYLGYIEKMYILNREILYLLNLTDELPSTFLISNSVSTKSLIVSM